MSELYLNDFDKARMKCGLPGEVIANQNLSTIAPMDNQATYKNGWEDYTDEEIAQLIADANSLSAHVMNCLNERRCYYETYDRKGSI